MPDSSARLTHPKYRPDIDGLRALAVLSVLLFHAFPAWLPGGYIGVDVFFVISGYLISTIIFENLERGTFTFVDFYARRVRRIFPALLLVLTVSYLFGWFALLADEFEQLGKHLVAGAGFVSNLVLWGEAGYFDNSAETKPLLHLWSLGIEEQFYLLWPLLVWLAWRSRVRVPALLAVLALASFALNILGIGRDAVATFYSPLTRFWELLAGSALAWVSMDRDGRFSAFMQRLDRCIVRLGTGSSERTNGRVLADVLSATGLALLLLSLIGMDRQIAFPGGWALVPVAGAVLIIVAGCQAWPNRHLLAHPLPVWFGLISYPLYLWHWPLLSFARIVEGEIPARSIRVGAAALAILLAWLTVRFVERPIRFARNERFGLSGLACAMSVLAVVGLTTFQAHGWPGRDAIAGFQRATDPMHDQVAIDDACRRYVGIEQPTFTYCRLNDVGGAGTVAVLGDSHAAYAYPGVAELIAAQGRNTVLLANNGCPPLLGVPIDGRSDTDTARCGSRIRELIDTLLALPDVAEVLMFTRGPLYFTGTEPVTGKVDVMHGRAVAPEIFQAGLQATMARLAAAGKFVTYVTENPELVLSVQACSPRPLRLTTRACSPSWELVRERQQAYLALVHSLQGVRIIETLDTFCPGHRCQFADERGELLYADSDHLSLAGSRFQAERLLAGRIGTPSDQLGLRN
ncbi:MAG: acyltransferase family protein [Burkholderiaceae bacterium]